MTNPITPTIGRVVLFRCFHGAAYVPALITRVHSDFVVNLHVIADGEAAYPVASVEYCDADETEDRTGALWTWMPYQKAVAAGETAPTLHAVPAAPKKPSTGSLEASDAAAAAVAVGPRVTLEGMKDKIVAEHYFTAGEAVHALGHPTRERGPLELLTVCILLMQNGFVLFGTSAPASPENFNADLGRQFAKQDALRQLWPLEGYLLRERLAAGV